jgi:hypothetical protein
MATSQVILRAYLINLFQLSLFAAQEWLEEKLVVVAMMVTTLQTTSTLTN